MKFINTIINFESVYTYLDIPSKMLGFSSLDIIVCVFFALFG